MMNNPREIALEVAKVLDSKKAVNIVLLEVAHLTVVADCFVIAAGRSANHVRPWPMKWKIRWPSWAWMLAAARAIRKGAGLCWTTPRCWFTFSMSKSGNTITLNGFGWMVPIRSPLNPSRTESKRGCLSGRRPEKGWAKSVYIMCLAHPERDFSAQQSGRWPFGPSSMIFITRRSFFRIPASL